MIYTYRSEYSHFYTIKNCYIIYLNIITIILLVKILLYYFIIFLCGQRTQQPQPTLYRAQDPCRRGRNAWGWTKKIQIAKRHHRGQSCPRPTEIIRKKRGMPLKAASQGILRNRTNTVGQPWEHGGGAIPGETVTSTLNAHN